MTFSEGYHLFDSLCGCECAPAQLENPGTVDQLITDLINGTGLTVVGKKIHDFNPGYTAAWLLAESHLTLHTWPELKKVQMDIFVCNLSVDNTGKADFLYDRLKGLYLPTETDLQRVVRR